MNPIRLLLGIWLCCFCVTLQAQTAPTTNGLYAQFNTSKGTFYCNLRYDLVPRTVANFVGLAEGSKAWLNYSNGALSSRPFYSGIIFHRVVSNFVVQAGSPNGVGNDDPGYHIHNEIAAGLNHNTAGVLAMANSGGTNSNGSQFYVTLSPQTALNGKYTVFGSVVSGMNVVTNIGAVAIDSGDKPITPVVINSVTILRIGTAASNFNVAAVSPPLPVPRFKTAQVTRLPPNVQLQWIGTTNSEYRVCYSGDLKHWQGSFLGSYTGPSSTLLFTSLNSFVSSVKQQHFFLVESALD